VVRFFSSTFFLIYKLWAGAAFWLSLFLLYPFFWVLMSRKEWYPASFTLKQFWSRLLRVLLFCPIRIEQKGVLPPPPYVLVSNHGSYLDTVFFYSVIPDYFVFLGKGELLKWPLFRLFFRKMDIPVHRGSPAKAAHALKLASDALKRGECVALYPEGTIPLDAPRMGRFKSGAFKLAVDSKVPIVALTWQNNYKILSDPENLFAPSTPQRIRVVVHHPITTAEIDPGETVTLREHTFEVIQSALPEAFHKKTTHEDRSKNR